MLDELNIQQVELMTNNPKKRAALENLGIKVVKRRAIDKGITEHNKHYIRTKTQKLGHEFDPHLLK